MGDKHFPSDPSGGKAIVLSMFEKQSLPSVKFFANKILKHQTQSDEELIICFILVAMNSFCVQILQVSIAINILVFLRILTIWINMIGAVIFWTGCLIVLNPLIVAKV